MWKCFYGRMVWRYYNSEGKTVICINGVYNANGKDFKHWDAVVTNNSLNRTGRILSDNNLELLKLKCLIVAKELGWNIEKV